MTQCANSYVNTVTLYTPSIQVHRVSESLNRALKARSSRRLSERILHKAWQGSASANVWIHGRNKDSYQVIYPGLPATGAGPDFQNAILKDAHGRLFYGDIEIHVSEDQWDTHGHQNNPKYNGVLFHVALESGGRTAITASGRKIPLLVFNRQSVAKALKPAPSNNCEPILDLGQAGDERFMEKSAGLVLHAKQYGTEQTLYAAILECLGYQRNRIAFRRLAYRLPLHVIRAHGLVHSGSGISRPAQSKSPHEYLSPRELTIGAILNWLAGWNSRPPSLPPNLISGKPPTWEKAFGRPANNPRTRLLGGAVLVARSLNYVSLEAFCRSLIERSPIRTISTQLMVSYSHCKGRTTLIGRERAEQIVINAILPGLCAIAFIRQDTDLKERCMQVYHQYPAFATNEILREATRMVSSLGFTAPITGAREQQGLIHCYKTMISSTKANPRQLRLT